MPFHPLCGKTVECKKYRKIFSNVERPYPADYAIIKRFVRCSIRQSCSLGRLSCWASYSDSVLQRVYIQLHSTHNHPPCTTMSCWGEIPTEDADVPNAFAKYPCLGVYLCSDTLVSLLTAQKRKSTTISNGTRTLHYTYILAFLNNAQNGLRHLINSLLSIR